LPTMSVSFSPAADCKVGAPMKWACEPALHLEEFYGGYDMLVSFSRSMLEGHPNASVL
jgi:hypothetical protein